MYGYFSYLVFMLPALLLGLGAQFLVKSRFDKFSKIASKRGITGAEAARMVLRAGNVNNVAVGSISGELNDHYDPRNNSISLSTPVYGSTSVAAIGVAAHEAGHALQYAYGYVPIKMRMSILPLCNFGSRFGPLMIIIGAMITYSAEAMISIGTALYFAGIILFSAVALFQLVTLPVELDASKRALAALSDTGMLDKQELSGAKKVLTAAALTYVAALVTSIMQVFYYASRVKPRR